MFIYEKSISHLIKNLQYIQVIYIYMHACTYMGVYLCTRIYNRVFITTIVVMKIRVEILWLLGFLWLRVFWIQNEKPPFCKTQLLINSQKSRSWRSWLAFFLFLEFFFVPCATRPLTLYEFDLTCCNHLLNSIPGYPIWNFPKKPAVRPVFVVLKTQVNKSF